MRTHSISEICWVTNGFFTRTFASFVVANFLNASQYIYTSLDNTYIVHVDAPLIHIYMYTPTQLQCTWFQITLFPSPRRRHELTKANPSTTWLYMQNPKPIPRVTGSDIPFVTKASGFTRHPPWNRLHVFVNPLARGMSAMLEVKVEVKGVACLAIRLAFILRAWLLPVSYPCFWGNV